VRSGAPRLNNLTEPPPSRSGAIFPCVSLPTHFSEPRSAFHKPLQISNSWRVRRHLAVTVHAKGASCGVGFIALTTSRLLRRDTDTARYTILPSYSLFPEQRRSSAVKPGTRSPGVPAQRCCFGAAPCRPRTVPRPTAPEVPEEPISARAGTPRSFGSAHSPPALSTCITDLSVHNKTTFISQSPPS